MAGSAEGARPWGPSRLTHLDFVVLSLYWVAIGYLWQSLGTLLLPDLVQQLVGATSKGRALSLLEGIGTVVAIVWQPLAGALSDRTLSRWGRRHPYILIGTLGDLVFLAALALSGAYWPLVVVYTLLQLTSNTAQGPYQGLLRTRCGRTSAAPRPGTTAWRTCSASCSVRSWRGRSWRPPGAAPRS